MCDSVCLSVHDCVTVRACISQSTAGFTSIRIQCTNRACVACKDSVSLLQSLSLLEYRRLLLQGTFGAAAFASMLAAALLCRVTPRAVISDNSEMREWKAGPLLGSAVRSERVSCGEGGKKVAEGVAGGRR